MGNRPPAATEAHRHAPRKPAARSLAARSLRWIVWGLGLAVVACVATYIGGFVALMLFAFLPALAVGLGASLLLILIVIWAFSDPPGVQKAAPLFIGMVTFSLVTLIGVTHVIPAIYDRHVESLKTPAVEAVERHRQRTGEYPASYDDPEGLPDEVSYLGAADQEGVEKKNAYVLVIRDRLSLFAEWRYDSRTKEWTYRGD